MKPRGVTLVEVLMSVVIVGISFVVLAQGLMSASHASAVSQAYTRATLVASEKMAEFETGQVPLSVSTNEVYEGDLHTYQVQITPNLTERAGLYEVTVVVSWSMKGGDHSTTLTRYMHESMRKP